MPGETISNALRRAAGVLEKAGCETPSLDGRLLLQFAALVSHADIVSSPERELDSAIVESFNELLARRTAGEPVSRIIGVREFYGREFEISPHVLDPRPDTETLIEAALPLLGALNAPRVLDMGTGSGAIAITLLCECVGVRGVATDVSVEAIEVATRNAARLGVMDRLELVHTSWAQGLTQSFDLIVSNPPYISNTDIPNLAKDVREYDPHLALDGGADGLDCYHALFVEALGVLKPGGQIIVEFGAGQHDGVRHVATSAGLCLDEQHGGFVHDLAEHIRCAVFTRS